MVIVRRVYVLLVSAISLLLLTWALIGLARGLAPFGPRVPATTIALEISIIVVSLPFFLVHWLWAQRLATEEEERGNVLRRIYLYGLLSVLLFAFAMQVLDLLTALLRLALGGPPTPARFPSPTPSPANTISDAIVGMLILAVVWMYQQWTILKDARVSPEKGSSATVHRLYILSFSGIGLAATAFSVIQLLGWLLFQVGTRLIVGGLDSIVVADEIARLLVGLSLWAVFWLQAQSLFQGQSEEERESALRKFYLYLVIFVAALGTVTGATFILAEFLRQALGLPPSGDLRDPLATMLVMALLWAFHFAILRGDIALASQAPRQAGVRRLYLYLVAGVGLAAFLVGLIGVGRVLIEALAGGSFGPGIKEELAWSTAALVAGLPVWVLSWRPLQNQAIAAGPAGRAERTSLVRKIYLYLYLFLASITVLSSVIYILYRLLSLALGDRNVGNLVSDLANALGFSVIAIGVWIVHGMALRGDGQIARGEQIERMGSSKVAVIDAGDGQWGRSILAALKRELPGAQVHPIGLTPAAVAAMNASSDHDAILALLRSADVIVGPWTLVANSQAVPEVAQGIAASPARKLLVPFSAEGWQWVGAERWKEDTLVRQAASAVRQVLEGEDIKAARPPVLTVILLIIAACIALQVMTSVLSFVTSSLP